MSSPRRTRSKSVISTVTDPDPDPTTCRSNDAETVLKSQCSELTTNGNCGNTSTSALDNVQNQEVEENSEPEQSVREKSSDIVQGKTENTQKIQRTTGELPRRNSINKAEISSEETEKQDEDNERVTKVSGNFEDNFRERKLRKDKTIQTESRQNILDKISQLEKRIQKLSMTTTITAMVFAVVSIHTFILWRENGRVQEDLKQVQSQLAEMKGGKEDERDVVKTNVPIIDELNNQEDIRKFLKLLVDTEHKHDDVKSQILILKEKMNINEKLANQITKTLERLDYAEQKLEQCIANTTKNAEDINGTRFVLSEAINKTHTETWKNLTQERNETSAYLSTNFMHYDQLFPIIGTGLIVELFLTGFVFYIYSKWKNSDQRQGRVQMDNHNGNAHEKRFDLTPRKEVNARDHQGMKWVLANLKLKPLKDMICILSFHEETSGTHVQLTKAALAHITDLARVEILPVVIKKHQQLLEIVPCKISFMFVDYNQRNVILEDTKKVLGDLKLTTAKAIKKYNSDLILVYVGQKGSQDLAAKDLYNKDITSVQSHPDLATFCRGKRFLSIYEEFTQYQIELICQIVRDKIVI